VWSRKEHRFRAESNAGFNPRCDWEGDEMRIAQYVFLLLAFSTAGAQTDKLQDAQEGRILSLENAWNQALQVKDVKALDLLLGGEFIDIECDGTMTNKVEYLANVKAPTVQLEHIVNESMQVQFYGRTAVVIGTYWEKGTRNGQAYLYHQRFSDTWINRSGIWLSIASQSTLIAH
jgi:hypothetical protein